MTFDEVMKKYSGKWADGKATILGPTGYYVIIATGGEGQYSLTNDGKRYVTEDGKPEAEEQKPVAKRGRKAVLSVDA